MPIPRPLHLFLGSATIALCIGFSIAISGAADQGSWVTKTPAPTKRTEVVAAAVGGRIYVIGGFARQLTFVSPTVEEYDPVTDHWRERAPMPAGRHHAGIGVVKDRLYVIGGFDRSMVNIWNPTASVYEYDAQSNEWRTRTPMPTPRGALAVAVLDGKLHAVGGYTRDSNTGAHEVYDPETDTWSSAAPRNCFVSTGLFTTPSVKRSAKRRSLHRRRGLYRPVSPGNRSRSPNLHPNRPPQPPLR